MFSFIYNRVLQNIQQQTQHHIEVWGDFNPHQKKGGRGVTD